MTKRICRVAWGLVVGLAVAGVCGSALLTPYVQVYGDRQAWEAFLDAARRGDYHFRLMVYLIAVTGLLFLGLELRRSKNRCSTRSPGERDRRQWELIIAVPGLVVLFVLVFLVLVAR